MDESRTNRDLRYTSANIWCRVQEPQPAGPDTRWFPTQFWCLFAFHSPRNSSGIMAWRFRLSVYQKILSPARMAKMIIFKSLFIRFSFIRLRRKTPSFSYGDIRRSETYGTSNFLRVFPQNNMDFCFTEQTYHRPQPLIEARSPQTFGLNAGIRSSWPYRCLCFMKRLA